MVQVAGGIQGTRCEIRRMTFAVSTSGGGRDGLLCPGRIFGWAWSINGETIASIKGASGQGHVRLIYRVRSFDDGWRDMDYRVALEETPCNFGKTRQWFLCPASGCGRRVAMLYGGSVFACRTCHRLVYASQREDVLSRMMRKSRKMEARLGWDGGFDDKPKGMHWRTYSALVDRYDRLDRAQFDLLERRFGACGENLADYL